MVAVAVGLASAAFSFLNGGNPPGVLATFVAGGIGQLLRSLWLGAPAGNNVWGAFAWSVAIIAVFAPLAVARYRRAAGQ